MKGYNTAKQTAERLGISDARVRQMIRDGVIKNAKKFGRDNAIPESEIIRLKSSERKPGRPAKPKG
ncbi:MAG: helix-turn-helix domain-containing protein [Blastocatellia bacterium]|nr:helix-turn-helix domain-containing protein [Blastocatellia bacterium]